MRTKYMSNTSINEGPRKLNDCLIADRRHKPARMLIDECWGEGELAMLIGESGVGKTVFSLQFGDAIARGRPINGFRMTALRQKTLYVDLRNSGMQLRARYAAAGGRRFSENLYIDSPPDRADLVEWLRATVEANGYRVIIVDEIFALSRTFTGTRETLAAMRELRSLTRELSISILVLAGTRRPPKLMVREADLMSNQILCDEADSVFALGHHPHKPGYRYLMQTRCSMRPVHWTEDNAPVCSIAHRADGVLSFSFDHRFEAEIDPDLRDLICNVKAQHDDGATYREIGDCLGISHVRAWRLKKLWVPSMPDAYVWDEAYVDDHFEPDEAEFKKTEIAGSYAAAESHNAAPEAIENVQIAHDTEDEAAHTTGHETPPFDPLAHLKHSWDKNDREIFVETQDERGRPTVWYMPNSKGNFTRYKRSAYGQIGQTVDGPMTPMNTG